MRARSPRVVAAFVVVAVAAVALALGAGAGAASQPVVRSSRITVMTRNLYLGANLLPLATSPPSQFQSAVSGLLAHVRASEPNARMDLIAQEIARAKPDLVGLQEVSLWRTGPLGTRPATHVVYDFLSVLTRELARRHASYRVVSSHLSLNLQAADASQDVRFTDGDAILARKGVTVRHVRAGDFTSQLTISTQALGTVRVTRGWTALDATEGGARLHFVNAHLESYSTTVRLAQARELVAGPLRSSLPTVLVGDLNSGPALPLAADRPPYLAIAHAGFKEARTGQPNCCFSDDLTTGRWDHIVDHIMTRPRLKLLRSYITGRETLADGEHPSDHGGVVSVLSLPKAG
jgi:endonuclease/exonuclease/phosphatase family metal-dependent hydrolase